MSTHERRTRASLRGSWLRGVRANPWCPPCHPTRMKRRRWGRPESGAQEQSALIAQIAGLMDKKLNPATKHLQRLEKRVTHIETNMQDNLEAAVDAAVMTSMGKAGIKLDEMQKQLASLEEKMGAVQISTEQQVDGYVQVAPPSDGHDEGERCCAGRRQVQYQVEFRDERRSQRFPGRLFPLCSLHQRLC